MRVGEIVAVCLSERGGIPKYPQDYVVLDNFGILGDYHSDPSRTFRSNDKRHITVVAMEALDYVNGKLGTSLKPGDLSENICVRGFGDLSDITSGEALFVNGAILRVVKQNDPCRNLRVYHRLMVKTIYGRRGLLCTVESGVGQVIKAGDKISIEKSITT